MMWIKPFDKKHPLLQLSELAARVQRLSLITKIHTINSMITIHKPQLLKHTKGKETLEKAQKYADKLLKELHQKVNTNDD